MAGLQGTKIEEAKLLKLVREKRAAIIWCSVILAVVLAGLIVYGQKTRFDQARVDSVVAQHDCAKGLKQLQGMKPSAGHVQGSITLLRYRSLCLSTTGKYKQAADELAKLRDYYQKANDAGGVAMANQGIKNMTYNVEHPNQPPKQVNERAEEDFKDTLQSVDQVRVQTR